MISRGLVLSCCLAGILGCGGEPGPNAPLLIHCTASLTRAMEEAGREYAESTGRPRPEINSASSLLLRKQIEADAPGDLFVAASPMHMDLLAQAGRIDPKSRVDELLRNRLSLLVRVESGIRSLDELVSPDVRVALANEGVPAGDYARDLLRSAGIWSEVSRSILTFPHEPAAFQAIQRGLIPAAFVYTSSLRALDDDLVREIALDATIQPPIRYPAAVLRKSRQPEEARRFLKFLRGPQAQAIFHRHGFIPVTRS